MPEMVTKCDADADADAWDDDADAMVGTAQSKKKPWILSQKSLRLSNARCIYHFGDAASDAGDDVHGSVWLWS